MHANTFRHNQFILCQAWFSFLSFVFVLLQILTKMDQHDEQSRKLERIHQALDPAYKKYSFSNIELKCFQNIYIYTYIY